MPFPYPKLDYLNPIILDLIKLYPTNGTHPYFWSNGFDGVTMDIKYGGEIVAYAEKTMGLKRTYCCGLTWEVYMIACERYAQLHGCNGFKLNNLGSLGIKELKADWFVATAGKFKGPVDALVPRGLGVEIEVDDIQPGDFVQIWRESGLGHSVIYLGSDGNYFHYWSTQKSTNGIRENKESFKSLTSIYTVRAFPPRLI
jgi:hypothetical protein